MIADDRLRPDGGIDALDPPTDIMDEETLESELLTKTYRNSRQSNISTQSITK